MMKRIRIEQVLAISIVIFLMAGMTSCFKNQEIDDNEMERIQNFLDVNDLDVEPTESGLYYVELIEGTGLQPVAGDTVEVHYRGTFLDGRIFADNMDKDPFRFVLGTGYVIEGWDEGITYMKEGGEAMLVIPSTLAYGTAGTYGIPGYTPLVYTVILEDVTPGPAR